MTYMHPSERVSLPDVTSTGVNISFQSQPFVFDRNRKQMTNLGLRLLTFEYLQSLPSNCMKGVSILYILIAYCG